MITEGASPDFPTPMHSPHATSTHLCMDVLADLADGKVQLYKKKDRDRGRDMACNQEDDRPERGRKAHTMQIRWCADGWIRREWADCSDRRPLLKKTS